MKKFKYIGDDRVVIDGKLYFKIKYTKEVTEYYTIKTKNYA
jgi:hypothetical protein